VSITCVKFCKAFSDEARQSILKMLQGGEMSVGEIVEAFKISQPTISHHLNVLKNVGLVTSRRRGSRYSILSTRKT